MKATYRSQCPACCCANCRYRRYDSNHDEMWCGHDTGPRNLPDRLVVEPQGWCEFWEPDPPAPPDAG